MRGFICRIFRSAPGYWISSQFLPVSASDLRRSRAAKLFNRKCFYLQKIALVSDNAAGLICFLDYLLESMLKFRFTVDSSVPFSPDKRRAF
jgi:hypothetical protein